MLNVKDDGMFKTPSWEAGERDSLASLEETNCYVVNCLWRCAHGKELGKPLGSPQSYNQKELNFAQSTRTWKMTVSSTKDHRLTHHCSLVIS